MSGTSLEYKHRLIEERNLLKNIIEFLKDDKTTEAVKAAEERIKTINESLEI